MPLATLGQEIFNATGNSDIFNPSVTLSGSRMADFSSDAFNQRLLNFRNASGELLSTSGLFLNGAPNNLINYWSTAGLADGGLVVTGSTPTGTPAFRIFNADGTERTSGATAFAGAQFYSGTFQSVSQVIALPNGGFFIGFTSAADAVVIDPLIIPANGSPPTSTGLDIRGRFFDAGGNAVVNAVTGTTGEFIVTQGFVNLPTYGWESRAGNQSLLDLDVLANGTVVVTERGDRFGPSGSPFPYTNIREVTAAGGQVLGQTPYFQVVIGTSESNSGTGQTVVLSSGTLLGLIFPQVQPSGRPAYGALTMQPLTTGGAVAGGSVDLGLNFWNNGNQNYFKALASNDGGFVIVFSDFSDGDPNRNPSSPNYDPNGVIGSNSDLYLRHYSSSGVQMSQLRITSAPGLDILRSFSTGPDGSFIVSWFNTVGQNLVEQRYVITAGAELARTGDGTSNTIVLSENNDWADAEGGHDTLYGQGGTDRLYGDAGDDYLNGGADDDTLNGGTGNDILDGGTGADVMDGGTGDDQYLIDNVADRVLDGGGTDTAYVKINGWTTGAGIDIVRLFDSATVVTGSAGVDILVANAVLVSTLNGGEGADTLWGSALANTLNGGGGDDIIRAQNGAATMIGGTGNDQFVVGNLGATIVENVGEGIDTVYVAVNGWTNFANVEVARLSAPGAVLLYGSSGSEDLVANSTQASTIDAGGGNDTIYGSSFNDVLNGNLGDDIIRGQGGADQFYGGQGNDQFVVFEAASVVNENAGEGYDIVYFVGAGTFDIGANVEEARLSEQGTGLIGNASVNLLVGNNAGLASILRGAGGADIIFGTAAADTIIGGTGDDTLYSQGGADRFVYDAPGWGTDQIAGFTAGARLQFTAGSGVTSFGQLNLNIAGGNTQVNHANGVILVFGASLGTGDFIFG